MFRPNRALAYARFRLHLGFRPAMITELLLEADPRADLPARAIWLARLLRWLKDPTQRESESVRLKFLLQLLDKNPGWKEKVGLTLRSVLRDAPALSLFTQTGFALETGLVAELLHRLTTRLLPKVAEYDLLEILTLGGWDASDADWIESLSAEQLRALAGLLEPREDERSPRDTIELARKEALLVLAATVVHFGLSKELRDRHSLTSVIESPFVKLNGILLGWGDNGPPQNPEGLTGWNSSLGLARQAIRSVYADMEKAGVSVSLVYRLEVILASLERMDELVLFLYPATPEAGPGGVRDFFARLVRAAESRGSVRDHLRSNLYLLSRKIVERNGHSGEHYLAQNGKELGRLFASGCGGGVVVVGITLAKILLHHLGLPPLPEAMAAWIIYTGGFLVMQFLGLTLATKLPSFLAAHLARKLSAARGRKEKALIRHDLRDSLFSQLVAFFGNLSGVVPVGLLFLFALSRMGIAVFGPAEGLAAVAEVHPWRSLAIPLGALTGIELWLSSLAGGWFENWLVYRRVPDALRLHPMLRGFFGDAFPKELGDFLEKHSSALAANVALGFLFGFVPLLGLFVGLNTESRHVTIASTRTLLGIGSLPPGALHWQDAAITLLGLLGIGLMNFFVSFGLALFVAKKATNPRRARGSNRDPVNVDNFNNVL